MYRLIPAFFFSFFCLLAFAQVDDTPTFRSIEEALKKPEEVVRLDLSNQSVNLSEVNWERFVNLEYLNLRNDHLRDIPENLTALKNLKVLDLSGNDITELPLDFYKLNNLEEIYLNEDKYLNLTKVIDALHRLPNLKILHLENDDITFIPHKIYRMRKLEFLYLNNNLIQEVPQSIMHSPSLEYFDIRENPLKIEMNNIYTPQGALKIKF